MGEITIIVWDGTSYLIKNEDYTLREGEEIIYRGSFIDCCEIADIKELQQQAANCLITSQLALGYTKANKNKELYQEFIQKLSDLNSESLNQPLPPGIFNGKGTW